MAGTTAPFSQTVDLHWRRMEIAEIRASNERTSTYRFAFNIFRTLYRHYPRRQKAEEIVPATSAQVCPTPLTDVNRRSKNGL
jgi:hypothetical protein